ncbi:MAG: DUF1559 domain-containing protein [Verrucomicrobiae bacterium]|nr:DUF1559 domain-containing protein [Verrucomicrobiae bacterium]
MKKPFGKWSFTLVELLVVVGVISLLAAMLAPAVRSAREKARQIKCLCNLRQISIGIETYRANFNDLYPYDPVNVNWMGLVNPYLNNQYYKLSCPSITTNATTYAINTSVCTQAVVSVDGPRVLVLDIRPRVYGATGWAPPIVDGARHNNGNNYLYTDGSVQWRSSADIPPTADWTIP